jgi:hypothetical protein
MAPDKIKCGLHPPESPKHKLPINKKVVFNFSFSIDLSKKYIAAVVKKTADAIAMVYINDRLKRKGDTLAKPINSIEKATICSGIDGKYFFLRYSIINVAQIKVPNENKNVASLSDISFLVSSLNGMNNTIAGTGPKYK